MAGGKDEDKSKEGSMISSSKSEEVKEEKAGSEIKFTRIEGSNEKDDGVRDRSRSREISSSQGELDKNRLRDQEERERRRRDRDSEDLERRERERERDRRDRREKDRRDRDRDRDRRERDRFRDVDRSRERRRLPAERDYERAPRGRGDYRDSPSTMGRGRGRAAPNPWEGSGPVGAASRYGDANGQGHTGRPPVHGRGEYQGGPAGRGGGRGGLESAVYGYRQGMDTAPASGGYGRVTGGGPYEQPRRGYDGEEYVPTAGAQVRGRKPCFLSLRNRSESASQLNFVSASLSLCNQFTQRFFFAELSNGKGRVASR